MVLLTECRHQRSKRGLEFGGELVPLAGQNGEWIIRFLFRK